MIKAVIFDLDGVILETAEIKTQAFRKLFEQEYPEKVDKIVNYHIQNMGISRYIKFKYIYKNILGLPLSMEEENNLGERFSRIALEEILRAPFVSGALEFIKTNKNKYSLFLASGTPSEELIYIAKKRGLFDYFEEIHGTPPGKTEIIIDILSRHNWIAKEAVFVGDAETDLKAASDTGLHFIARITSHYKQLVDCEYKIDNLEQLETLILAL